jgi:AP-1 complex subunit gamma-1
MLLDLMGGSDVGPTSPTGANGTSQNTADLLADILGGGDSSAPQPAASSNTSAIMDLFGSSGTPAPQTPSPAPTSASQDLLGGLGAPSSPAPAPPTTGPSAHTAFNKNDLVLTLQVQRNSSGTGAQILARFRNESNFNRITGAGLQAAVPKSQRLQLSAINKADLDGGEEGTQAMRIAAVTGVSIFLFFFFLFLSFFST